MLINDTCLLTSIASAKSLQKGCTKHMEHLQQYTSSMCTHPMLLSIDVEVVKHGEAAGARQRASSSRHLMTGQCKQGICQQHCCMAGMSSVMQCVCGYIRLQHRHLHTQQAHVQHVHSPCCVHVRDDISCWALNTRMMAWGRTRGSNA